MRNKKMKINLARTALLFSLIALLGGISLKAGQSHSVSNSTSKDKKPKNSILEGPIKAGNIEEVKRILKHNPNIDLNESSGEENFDFPSPLIYAINAGEAEIVRFLVDNGSKVDALNGFSEGPLYFAVQKNNVEITSFLIDRGANVNIRNGMFFSTPLSDALMHKNFKMFKLLMEDGGASLKCIIPTYAADLDKNLKFKHYVILVQYYYNDGTMVTKKSVDQNGKLIDPEIIPNYLPLAVVKKDITQMNSCDVSPDFNLKNYIIRMQLRSQDKKIVQELVLIYLKNNPTETSLNEILLDEYKVPLKEVVTKYTLLRNNKMKKLNDAHFSFVRK